jgi:hypothetical protein
MLPLGALLLLLLRMYALPVAGMGTGLLLRMWALLLLRAFGILLLHASQLWTPLLLLWPLRAVTPLWGLNPWAL